MPRLDLATWRKCIDHGLSPRKIKQHLNEEALHVSIQAIYSLLRKYRLHQTYVDLPRKTIPRKITDGMVATIDAALTENDELTARQLREILSTQHSHLEVSIATVKRAHKEAGWTSTRPHYCQLIRQVRTSYTNVTCTLKQANLIITDDKRHHL